MRLFITTTAGIIASTVFLALMTCGSPTNPFDKSQANVKLILKSSSGQKNDTAITDTVGNTDTIGLVLYLAHYFDSTRLEVRNDTILEKSMLCTEKNRTIDTVYYRVVFSSPGSRSVTAKGYIPGELSLRAAATIHVIGRPQPNRKPNLNLSGSTTVTAGDTVKLHVSATDPDSGQTVTITAARLPAKSTFFKDTFMWATALTDAGSDTAVFIARDDGTPIALSDTDTVVITVSEIPLNRPPRWNDRVIDKTGMPGVPVVLTLIDKCSDPDGDALTFSLLPGAPAGDTIVNSAYSFIPADGDTGAYAALIVARDPGNLNDTLILNLTIVAVDKAPPVMRRIAPPRESLTVATSTYQVIISGGDESGIASVKCSMGADTFPVHRSDDTLYTATVSGLQPSGWNNIRFIATDSAPAANSCTLHVHLMYDRTIPDKVPPAITLLSPAADTVIGVDLCSIKARCTDDSGVALVRMSVGADTVVAVRGSGADSDVFTATVKGLVPGQYSTVFITAVDSAAERNSMSIPVVRIKYDNDATGPVITRVTPSKDSVSTNASNYTITVSCVDQSDVASVKGALGSQSFSGTKGSGNNWTIPVTGLIAHTVNEVAITATDSSLRANTSSINVYITYDPTMDDADGPTIKQISGPVSGSIVPAAAIEIVDSVGDPSGIDSVYWTRNNGAKKTMPAVSGKTGHYSLKDTITEGKPDTLVVTAVDKSTRRNRSTQTIIFRFIQAPTITVQPASQAVCSGGQAIFSMSATGTAPLSCQWRTGATNPANITGAIYPACTLNNALSTTILSCMVSNQANTNAISNLCTLTVNTASTKPTASANPSSSICPGGSTNLTVSAGTLGTGASWKWYQSKTGNPLTSLTVSPASNTWYFVRGEGVCGNSPWDSIQITVNTVSTTPTATATSPTLCSGSSTKLKVSAGTLGTGASWKWYSGSCGGASAGAGDSNTVSPIATTSYYVRAEGGCQNSACSSPVQISVNFPPSTAPTLANPASDSNGFIPVSLLIWNKVTGATGYTLQVATNIAFSDPIMNITTTSLNDTARATTGLSNSTRYYWRVGATNGCGQGAWKADSFITTITWTAKNSGLNNYNVHCLTGTNGNLFMGTEGGVYHSTNNGDSWDSLNTGLTDLTIRKIVVNGSTIFALTFSGIFRSTNNGTNWILLPVLTSEMIGDLIISGSTIYAKTSNDGIYYSNSNGDNWSHISGFGSSITGIAVNGSYIYAGTSDGIYYTVNNGGSWPLYGLSGSSISGLYLINGIFHVVISNVLYFSSVGSQNWTQELGLSDNIFLLDGTENKLIAAASSGASFSSNQGRSWSPTDNSIGNPCVSAAMIGGYMYVAPRGQGVFRSPLP